jgi:hypothetical protein
MMQTLHAAPSAVRLGWLAPALTLGALALTTSAHAQVTQYSSRTSFNAATSGLTTFTLDGYAPAGSYAEYPTGLTVDGVAFSASGKALYVGDPGDGNGNPFNGHQYVDSDDQQTLNIALPTGTTAFGADFFNYGYNSTGGSTITALVNGTTFTFTEPNNTTSAFAGFTSSAPITSLSFSGGTYGPALDNLSFGTAGPAAVPEASTTVSFGLLLVLGLGGVVVTARRKMA